VLLCCPPKVPPRGLFMQAVSRPQIRCAYEASDAVLEAVAGLEHDQQRLAFLQENVCVDVSLDIDLRLAGE
jgi:hypothetical protein